MLRPEQVMPAPPTNGDALDLGRATVSAIVFQGTHLKVAVRSAIDGLGELKLSLPADTRLAEGDDLPVYAAAGDIVVLTH